MLGYLNGHLEQRTSAEVALILGYPGNLLNTCPRGFEDSRVDVLMIRVAAAGKKVMFWFSASILALKLINLALHSEVQGRIEILGVGERAIVVGLGTTPIAIVGEAEIEDEVPGPGRVLKVADDLRGSMSPRFSGCPVPVRRRLGPLFGSAAALDYGGFTFLRPR